MKTFMARFPAVLGQRMVHHVLMLVTLACSCACALAQEGQAIEHLAMDSKGTRFVIQYRNASNHRLVLADTGSGAMQIIAQPSNERWRWPVFSADGKWIAINSCAVDGVGRVQEETSRIDVMRNDGSERRTIVAADGSAHGPFSFSPDGQRLVFGKGRVRDSRRPTDFDVYEVRLDGSAPRQMFNAQFYQVSSVGYYGEKFYLTGQAPLRYLAGTQPAPAAYLPNAPQEDKARWGMQNNSLLYIRGDTSDALVPFVTFDYTGSAILPWQQQQEIESVRVAAGTQRLFAVMRHREYPLNRKIRHYIRDVFVMEPDRSFRRLTHFNTVQFKGFDVTPDGHYLAVVPVPEPGDEYKTPAFHRIDTFSGDDRVFQLDFSRLF